MTPERLPSLQSAAWPDMFDSLQTAYAQLNEAQFELEHRIAEVDETRELFERVVESMSEALMVTDRTGRLQRLNRAAGKLLGVRTETVLGRPLSEVWAAEGIPATPWQLMERSPKGAVSNLDVDFPGDDGTVRHASVSCSLLRDKFGAISGLLLVARDVTLRTRRAEAQRLLAEAGALLGRSLDLRTMLRDLAQLCAPRLADWCVVAVQGARGMQVTAAHRDQALDERLAALAQGVLRGTDWSQAVTAAIETRTTQTRAGAPFAEALEGSAELNRAFGGDCSAAVPLVARGRALGAIGLVWDAVPEAQRQDNLELAEELAQRAALSIDNARLHESERRSRRAAETVAERLRRVQNVTDAALAHLDLDGLLHELLERIVASLRVDVGAVMLLDSETWALVPRAVHGIPDDDHEKIPVGEGYAGRIAADRRAMAVEEVDPGQVAMRSLRRFGITSLAGVPLLLEGRMTGVLTVSSRARRSFTTADMTLLRLVGDRVALAIENARLYERERSIAETLQRALLPHKLPEIPGLELAARYLPGAAGVDVGGDWYDVIALPEGRAGVAVGDVGGRGIQAAVTMGQLRTALRTYAFEGFSPARALEHLNRLSGDTQDVFATVTYLLVDPATGRMRYANAGHLPPLLLQPDGETSWLQGGHWLPIGVRIPVDPPTEDEVELRPGATLLLYTDGLVERRSASIDDGLERLAAALRSAPADLDALLEHVLGQLLADEQAGADDIALLAVRLLPKAVENFRVRFRAAAPEIRRARHEFERWLSDAGLPGAVRQDLILATSEVCANAVEHPRKRASPDIELAATLAGDGWLIVTVHDHGIWQPSRFRPMRGFGLGIARKLVDELEIDRAESGTTVRMRRRVNMAPDQRP